MQHSGNIDSLLLKDKHKFQNYGSLTTAMTNKNTTTKATDVFNFIVEFKATHDGNSPTMREIGDACGVSSTSMVNYYLNLLERVGWITMERPLKGTSRMISVRGGQWRLINEANFA